MPVSLDTLLGDWKKLLTVWAGSGALTRAVREALLLKGEPEPLKRLVSQWGQGDCSGLPPIVLLPASSMPGATGAYAIGTGTIYLNQDWLAKASAAQAIAVLTEELGHWLDSQIRSTDTAGDEGALLSRLLMGPELSPEEESSLRSEDDRIQITLASGQVLLAEASTDSLAPTIQGLTLGATTLDPSQPGGAYLSAALRFSDNLSGLSVPDSGSIRFRSTSSNQTWSISFNGYDLQGSTLAGTLYASRKLDPFAAAGSWSLDSIQLSDKAGNSFSKFSSSSDWTTFLSSSGITQTSFQIAYGPNPAPGTGPDSLPPSIQSFSLDSTSLDPSQPGGAYLSAALRVSDNVSGFNRGSIRFRSPSSGHFHDISLSLDNLQGSTLAGTLYASGKLAPAMRAGSWELDSILLGDKAGNSLYKASTFPDWRTFLSSSGITQTSFQVAYGPNPAPGPGPDSLAPTIQGFSLVSSSLDPSQPGGALLSGRLSFKDNVSGFDRGYVEFSSESGQFINLFFGYPVGGGHIISGTELSGVAFASAQLNATASAGMWRLSSVWLSDKAGNSLYKTSRNSSDWNSFLSFSGITQTSFQVAYGPNPAPGTGPDSLAPTIQGFSLDSSSLDPSQPGGARLSGRLSFKDNVSGLHSGYLRFSSDSGETTSLYFGFWGPINMISGSELNGVAFASSQLAATAAAGTWRLTSIHLNDRANNSFTISYSPSDYWTTFLSSSGITQTSFDVVYGGVPTTPVISLAVSPASVAEDGTANLIYTFSRTGPTTSALTVNYTVGGTATLGTDYTGFPDTPATKTVSFAAGAATAIVTVDAEADTTVEWDETVALTLAEGAGYNIGTTASVSGIIKGETYTAGSISVNGVNLGSTPRGYALKISTSAPLFITNAGVVAAAAGGWRALAAASSGSGYDLYWKHSNGTYAKWILNSSAALTSGFVISTADFLQAETNLAIDLDGDGKTGFSFSATKTVGTVQFGSTQLGYALINGSNPLLAITNAGAVATEAGGWSALAAAAAGNGYELYWKNSNGTYAKWILNSSAALTRGFVISTADFLQAETNLAIDLDGDGKTGFSFSAAKTIAAVQFGSSQLGYALKNGNNPLLAITNAGAVATEAGGWSALAAAAAGNGYELYWKKSNGTYAKWILNSSAALTSGFVISTADFLQAETNLATDLDGDGKTGFSFSAAKTIAAVQFGSSQLGYALKNNNNPLLAITNAGAVATEAGGWSALAAAAAGDGYELYWKNSNGTYAKWILNSSAALTSGLLISTADFLQAETNLATDLDGDGKIGFSFSAAKTIGTVQFGSSQLGYALKNNNNPLLAITNAGAVATEAGGWSALAASAAGNGYELYWKNYNGTYAKWILNSSAALTSGLLISTADFLQAETNLATDLDGDGKIGFSFSAAKTIAAVQFGSSQLGYALKNNNNPLLAITNAGAVATEAGGWSALAAAAAGNGYELYWKNSSGTYAKWILNSSAALTSGFVISTADFLQAETNLAIDLDGDGKTGFSFSATKTVGTVQFGSTQLGYALINGNNPLLSVTNAGAVATEAGGWSALAAAAAGDGYELYWKNSNGTYAKWILNSSAALTSGFVISTADFLQAETNLAIDLDGDGKTGFSFSAAKTIGTVQFGSSQLGYALKNSNNPLLAITNAGAVATEAGGWSALAAAAAGNGYELYWKNSNGTYAKWILNSSAALTRGFVISTADFLQAESNLATDLDADGIIGLTFTPSPSSTSTIYSGSFTTPNEVDSYSVDVAPRTIISASITTPSQQSLYPRINLFDASSSLLKGPLTYAKDFADLGMFDLITGKATLKVDTQTGFLGDYELNLSFINREAVKNEVVSLTNAQRLQAGLNPLTRNLLLESAAQAHVADMDASNRYLAHTGSNGSDPVTRIAATGYKGGWIDLGNGQLRTISSENAAAGQKTPAEVVDAWMNSPGHRAAILDPYTKEIGIGFEFDNEVGDITAQSYKAGTTYWVQNFGYPWQTGMQVWF